MVDAAAALADNKELCLLWTTLSSIQEAESLASHLLAQQLIACANMFPGMRSCYQWQGAVCCDEEVGMLLKTTRARAEACAQALRAQHPYEVPCILRIPIDAAHPPFAAWINGQTAGNAG